MGVQSKSKKQPITVKQVGLASLILAIIGGIVGFYTGGLESTIIGFVEWLIAGFILLYFVASFIELLRK
jgi:F0F1-type ATP synthase assembly protein I